MKKLLFACLLGVIMVVLAACGEEASTNTSNGDKKEAKQEVETVKVGSLNNLSNASLYIGDEIGIFQKYGVDLQFESFKGAQPMSIAVQTNEVEVGTGAFTAGLFNLLMEGDSPIRIVADGSQEKKGYPSTAVIVTKELYDSGVTTIEVLKGKKIGITQNGASVHYMLGKALETAGLTFKDVEVTPLGSLGNIAAALESGQIDASSLPSTLVEKLVANGQVEIIAPISDLVEMQAAGIYLSGKMLENKDLAVRFLAGYIDSARYYYKNVLEATDISSEDYSRDLEILAKQTSIPKESIAKNLNYIDENAEFWTEDLKTWSNWYLENGLIQTPLDLEKVVDTELYNEALKLIEE
ncbi:ABC transporter substrate-binding protein [Neobacillus drentensis]|uniref:ABC transporter substrate-binding protein n=1 Tax=Neobacillus drentensis TaxID=220684 RepID=UPI002FFF33D3